MSKECTTHHHACDCREEKFKQLERENAALRAEKERLDWLERNGPWDRWIDPDGPDITLRKPIRECIDAARKEAQP